MSAQAKERRNWIGVSLLVIGAAFLSRNFHWDFFQIPDYFYTWQFVLLGLGVLLLLLGRKSGVVLILIGGFFFFSDEIMGLFHNMSTWWPLILILIGIALLTQSGTYRQKG